MKAARCRRAARVTLPLSARAETPALSCDTPLDLIRLANPLSHVAQKLAAGRADHHRRHRFVVDRRRGREFAGRELSEPARGRAQEALSRAFDHRDQSRRQRRGSRRHAQASSTSGVIAAKPDLVLWQLGTNSVIRDHRLTDHGAAIREGLNQIRAIGADVVLIDPQFAPKVIVKPEAEHMVDLIAATAKAEDVDLFRRFEVMKRWYNDDHMTFESFVSPDGLHMNDWSYACFANGLAHGDRRSGRAAGHVGDRPVASGALSRRRRFSKPRPAPSADPRSGRRGARARPRNAPAHRQCRVRRAARASAADAWSWSGA